MRARLRSASSARGDADGAEAGLLSSEELRQLERLSLPTIEAMLAGVGVGGSTGTGAAGPEFADYRPYTPGDDLRYIDWNIHARLGELMVKIAPEERHLELDVLIDTSRSMSAGGGGKLWHARRIAAALGAVALVHLDSVRLHALGDGRAQSGARLSTPGMLGQLQAQAAALPESTHTDLPGAVRAYRRSAGEPPDLVVLIGDALVAPEDFSTAIGELAGSRQASTFVHVIDPAELRPRLRGRVELRDSETGQTLELTLSSRSAAAYARLGERFRAEVERRCRARGMRYLDAPTDVEPLRLLASGARAEGLLAA